MCFIVLYFMVMLFFAGNCQKVLYFWKNVLYFWKLFEWVELPSGCVVPGS